MRTRSTRSSRALAFGLCAITLASAIACGGPRRPESFELASYQNNRADVVDDFTKLDRGKAWRDVKRVFIPSFQVEYIVSSSASAGSYSSNMSSSRTTAFYELGGLDDARVQGITDALYSKFVAGLEAQGIEVVSHEALAAQPAWAKLQAKGEATPVLGKSRLEPQAGKSIVATPTGTAVYYTQTDPKLGLAGAFKNIGSINKGENAGSFEGALMEALDADMVKARLVIGFAQLAAEGGWNKSSSVAADFRFTIAPKTSEVKIVKDYRKNKAPFSSNILYQPRVDKAAHAYLTQPIFSPAPFVESIEDTTPVGARAGEAVANTLSVLASLSTGSGISTSKTRQYTVTIDPEVYQSSAEQYAGVVLSMFHDQLAGAR